MNFSHFGRATAVRLFFFLAVVAAVATGCGGRSESKTRGANANANTSASNEDAIAITTATAVARQVPTVIQATGSLVALESSNIAPKTAGKIVNVTANVGDFVSQGQVIARIDDKDALLRLAEARASVAQAQASVRQAEARIGLAPGGKFSASEIPEVRAAGSNYEQTLAELKQAEANEKRYRELVETGDVAMIQYEQFRTTRDTARARVNQAKQQLDAASNAARQNNEAVASAKAAVESAKTQVGTAEQAVADTVIRAPFSGYISERPVAVGEFATSATNIATLVRTNPIKAQIQIAEADVPFVTAGRAVQLTVDAYKDRNFGGSVTAINPSIDPNSRSAIVEAQVDNSDNKLRAGMFVTAKITRDGGSLGVFVPKEAVLYDEATQNYRVFVIVDGVAKLRVVQRGGEENGTYQILNGVAADEVVATSNLAQLFEGAKVRVG